MLEKITINYNLKVGDEVGTFDGGIRGTVVRRWGIITKLDEETILVKKSYTIKPIKGQVIKLPEDQLNRIVTCKDGIAF